MDFLLNEHLHQANADTVVLGVYHDKQLQALSQALPAELLSAIQEFLKHADFTGKIATTQRLYVGTTRILLVGLGKPEKLDGFAYQKLVRAAAGALNHCGCQQIACWLTEVPVRGRSLYFTLRQAIESFSHAVYEFKSFKGKKSSDQAAEDEAQATPSAAAWTVFFPLQALDTPLAQAALQHGKAIAAACNKVRDLANTPGNVCTPTYLADTARAWVKPLRHTKIHVLSESDIQSKGMGAFAAVAKGSEEPAQLVVMEYQGADATQAPIALIGKGITFDTGGISLKNSQIIMGMKYDMCGAATVLAVFEMAAQLQLPINLVAAMACAENMPSGHATRPDDIVTTLSGITVEIANTDAEGRLVLSDTLTYVQQKYAPATLIDVATLTGACVAALGRLPSGLLSNNEDLQNEIITDGQRSLDRVWPMPLWDEYQPLVDSQFADIINIGTSGEAGTITAACFLSRFIENDTPWAHLDVAGTAFNGGKEAHATGRPTALLCEFLLRRSHAIPDAQQ